MNQEPQRTPRATAPCCQWVDADGVSCQESGQVDRRAHPVQRRRRDLLPQDRTGTPSAPEETAADSAHMRPLLIQHMTSSHEAPSKGLRP